MSKHVAIYVLWDEQRGLALMENRPDLLEVEPDAHAELRATGEYWVYPGGKLDDSDYQHTRTDDDLVVAAQHAMVRECLEEVQVGVLDFVTLPSYTGTNGWTTLPFRVDRWHGTVPDATRDRFRAALRWVSPNDIVQQSSGPTARLHIAKLLQVDCEICGARTPDSQRDNLKSYLRHLTQPQRSRVMQAYRCVPRLVCPACFIPLASTALDDSALQPTVSQPQ